MSALQIKIPDKLVPVFTGPAMYRGAYGGRGSAKTRTFAKMAAVRGAMFAEAGISGVIVCGREFMNSLDESSLAEVKAAIAEEPWLASKYDVGDKYIRTRDGRVEFVFIGLRRSLNSIKSKSRILILWVDEGEEVSEGAWIVVDPTVREAESEIWVTWNPRRKKSATHKRFREDPPPECKIVQMNWRDNPWFPEVLNKKRLADKEKRPDQYEHIWEGAFATAIEGAYYARCLIEAREQRRICRVSFDPLMRVRVFCDLGGTGAKADAFAMWPAQFIDREIRTRDYYEAQGQSIGAHVQWLHSKGYTPQRADIYLPHDGETNDRVVDVSFESAFRAAGYDVTVIPNQGKGAAKMRVEAGRRRFPMIWFDEESTEDGRDALGWYHEKKSDDEREALMGPEHDWSSHGCFEGSTEVLTRYGTCQIRNLPETGEVLTPCGWKPYILPRITRRNARLVEVEFTDGYSVRCTPDHLFLTGSGWKSAESLIPSTAIRSTLTKSRSISMAVSTGVGRAIATFRAGAKNFIGMFGLLLSGRSRPVVISTTGTATFSTIGSKTWSAFQLRSTCQSRGQSALGRVMAGSPRMPETRPLSGTSPQRVGFGTSATPSAPRAGPNGNAKKGRASTAASHIWPLFARAGTPASIVRRLARSLPIGRAASKTHGLLRIANVRPLSEAADVWDITVPDGHWFSLANGAVVHNSDAFGLMCVAYEEPRGKKPVEEPNDEWVV